MRQNFLNFLTHGGLFNTWRRAYHSLSESCELCVCCTCCVKYNKMFLLIDTNWLREMLLKKLFHIWWDFVYSLMKTIKSMFFNNKRKISIASVNKDNVASFKEQNKKLLLCDILWSLIIILYLLSCMLRYVPPRSVLICQSFHHTQLTYFANPRKQGGN